MIVKGQRMCVPEYGELKRDIREEAHSSAYAMHPGSTKMYRTLKEHYWWNGMKKEIAGFVSRCLTCQQVKAEHQRPAGKTQLLPIPVWKWEKITMDFVTGLPRTQRQHDAIWVIVDRLTKSAHFLPVNVEDSLEKLAKLYVDEIVRLSRPRSWSDPIGESEPVSGCETIYWDSSLYIYFFFFFFFFSELTLSVVYK